MQFYHICYYNESLDSAVERGLVFLWLVVNILVFYRFPKSFNPNVVLARPRPSMTSLKSDTTIDFIYTKILHTITRQRMEGEDEMLATVKLPATVNSVVGLSFVQFNIPKNRKNVKRPQ